jgi:hypothetical protein
MNLEKRDQIVELLCQASTLCEEYRAIDKQHDTAWRNIDFVIAQALRKVDELHFVTIQREFRISDEPDDLSSSTIHGSSPGELCDMSSS